MADLILSISDTKNIVGEPGSISNHVCSNLSNVGDRNDERLREVTKRYNKLRLIIRRTNQVIRYYENKRLTSLKKFSCCICYMCLMIFDDRQYFGDNLNYSERLKYYLAIKKREHIIDEYLELNGILNNGSNDESFV
jgi:hypothetical protein